MKDPYVVGNSILTRMRGLRYNQSAILIFGGHTVQETVFLLKRGGFFFNTGYIHHCLFNELNVRIETKLLTSMLDNSLIE